MVNEQFGHTSQLWKSWWAMHGLLNVSKHYCGEHGDCNRFLYYSTCAEHASGPASRPESGRCPSWADYEANAQEVRGIADAASLLMDTFTVSSEMRKRVFTTVLFMRDCQNESWNHKLGCWSAQYSHITLPQHEVNCCAVSLDWNEDKDHAVHSVGELKHTKTHRKKKVYVPASYRLREHIKGWQLDGMTRCFPCVPEVTTYCSEKRESLKAARTEQQERADKRTAKITTRVKALPPAERAEAQALLHKHSEGTLKPCYEGKYRFVHYCMPPSLRTGKSVTPWPLPRVEYTAEDLAAHGVLVDADQDEHDDGPGGAPRPASAVASPAAASPAP